MRRETASEAESIVGAAAMAGPVAADHRLGRRPDAAAGILRVRGPYAAMTAPRLMRLVRWSLAAPGRGFGLLPDCAARDPADEGRAAAEPYPSGDAVGIASPDGLFVHDRDGRRPLDGAAFGRRLAGAERFAALVLTGHGAEHCMALGPAAWLATDAGYGLPGAVLAPQACAVPLVFLNGCGTLRLAGSPVPRALSLAARLHAGGATVLGPMRNLRGGAALETAFVESVRAGQPAGRIATRLNRLLARAAGELPSIVVLGEPGRAVAARPSPGAGAAAPARPLAGRAMRPRSPADPPDDAQERLHAAARAAGRALRQGEGFARWAWPAAAIRAAIAALEPALHLARQALAVGDMSALAPADLALLAGRLDRARRALAAAILDDAAATITAGDWLQAAYAPVMRRRLARSLRCRGTCSAGGGGLLADYRFDDPAGLAAPVFARECDRCGSVSEWMARARPPGAAAAGAHDRTAWLDLPPLGDAVAGRVLVHRSPRPRARAWPEAGGRVRFAMQDCPVAGRVTLAALAIGPDGLVARYGHLFRHPADGRFHPIETEDAA